MEFTILEQLAERLRRNGWEVTPRPSEAQFGEIDVLKSYAGGIPEDYLKFLRGFLRLANKGETTWFISAEDFIGTSDAAFAWNEFEQQSLQAAQDDPEMQREVQVFWRRVLPIMISVKDGYAFAGIDTGNLGRVVVGREPEYEQVDAVADSFSSMILGLSQGKVAPQLEELL